MSLSDPEMVSLLIRHRCEIYPPDALEQSFSFRELLTCIYIDLDRLIEKARLSVGEAMVVGLMMKGYTIQDIVETEGMIRQAILTNLKRASEKISAMNNAKWLEHISRKYQNQPFYLLEK